MTYTNAEIYTLPSKGLIYNIPFNPDIKLRTMSAADEMKRLSSSESQYKVMCDLIEDCIVSEKLPISVYDMCLGDYEFLLHKLRVVTYGPEYKMTLRCPVCGGSFDTICDLDSLEVMDFDEKNFEELVHIHLPITNKDIELNMQTPRILDDIAKRKKEMIKKAPGKLDDPGLLLTLMSMVKTVDGQVLSEPALEKFIRNMPMRDANILMQKGAKLNDAIGLNTEFQCKCKHCDFEMTSTFRFTSEFFGPTID